MDCQKLIVYEIVALVGLYLLQTCGIKLPFIDNFEVVDSNGNTNVKKAFQMSLQVKD